MDCCGWLIVFSVIIMHLPLTSAQSSSDPYHFCNTSANYTANSAFSANLNSTLSSLLANATQNNGFYNASTGQNPDTANGLFQCRGDVSPKACQSCVKTASEDIVTLCPSNKEAIIWYDYCMLRYANRSIFEKMEEGPAFYMWNINNLSNPAWFNETLRDMMKSLVPLAVVGSPPKMYATWDANLNDFQTMYLQIQCTRDISSLDCQKCLSNTVEQIPVCCDGKKGGRVYKPSCNIRYETYLFYDESTDSVIPSPATSSSSPASPPSPTNSSGEPKNRSKALWIAVGTSVSAVVLVVLLGAFIFRRRRMKETNEDEQNNSQEVQLLEFGGGTFADDYSRENLQGEKRVKSQDLPLIGLDIINAATQHFSNENKLGAGGFGPVYKGTLADGKEIAVKRLSRTSGQGLQEFRNEVTLIARLQHRNLVRLLGCCLEGDETLLIYEYMPNKSLDLFLFESTRNAQLDWKLRLSIIGGIARGLLYLHEDSRLRIIHRDLKVSNILLDHEMNPKISDFGMARIFGGNQSEANTNRVVGTYGYMAPEYAMEGLFSVKSDVYSFGVLLLEIISGKKNSGFYLSGNGQSLLTFAWKLWSEGQGLELLDPLLVKSCAAAEVLKCIHIGLLCVQEDPTNRPTMSSVVVMLASDTITLPQPTQPPSIGRFVARSAPTVPTNEVHSINEATLSDISPR